MGTINVWAGRSNYIDHLAPIWQALPPEIRGYFWIPRGLERQAERRGVREAIWTPTPIQARPGEGTLLASYHDEKIVAGPIAFLEHGAGQHYGGVDASSTKDQRRKVAVYLAPNQGVADRMGAVFPSAERIVVGCPRLDRWAARKRSFDSDQPTIGLAWHWGAKTWPEARTAWTHYRPGLRPLNDEFPGQLIGHGHPKMLGTVIPDYNRLRIPVEADSVTLLDRIDTLSADNTSLIYEAAAIGIPVVILDAPHYRRHVHHGLRFWEWADIGPRISDPREWGDAIRHAHDPQWAAPRQAAAEAIYGPQDGKAAARAAEALIRWATTL